MVWETEIVRKDRIREVKDERETSALGTGEIQKYKMPRRLYVCHVDREQLSEFS